MLSEKLEFSLANNSSIAELEFTFSFNPHFIQTVSTKGIHGMNNAFIVDHLKNIYCTFFNRYFLRNF